MGRILISLDGRLYVWKPSADELAKISPSSRPNVPQPILVDPRRPHTIKLWQPDVSNFKIERASLGGKGRPRETVQYVLLTSVTQGERDQAVAEGQKRAIVSVEEEQRHAEQTRQRAESRDSRSDRSLHKPWLWLAFALLTGPPCLALMIFVARRGDR